MPQNKDLIKILNKYILQQDDDPEQKELFLYLKQNIHSPAFVAACEFIPERNQLKIDAYILSDAFEALTNGMYAEESLNQMESLDPAGMLYPWKYLILSLSAFYAGKNQDALEQLDKIDTQSGAAVLIPFLKAILEHQTVPQGWESLSKAILESNTALQDAVELIKESAPMEDLLLETGSMLIKDIQKDDPRTAAKVMLWMLQRLQEDDVLSDKAVGRAKSLFGDKEGYRLSALATLSFDPDRSLLLWLHALLAALDESSAGLKDVRAYLNIIQKISQIVENEYELEEEYLQLLNSMTNALKDTIRHALPSFPGTVPEQIENPFETLQILAGIKQPLTRPRKERLPAVQLELFSF